ncbi:multidrug and toxin extrusion protein 2-like [Stylophora pistillata]|uniref:multidrug and toxin extrusion protein 2-like n=1 Tax=Stylophora pistillata TaxID=50429 RepID=UPI000C05447F|nr:multidrug and toxin extrusion protein 2-like [Stylophora pistillata]XP_022804843.1 multidrug and toxin extrusion protein 2-like [Stylophora pistillata]
MANDVLESVSPNDEFDVDIRQQDEYYQLEKTSGCLGGLLSSSTCIEIRQLFTLAWPTVFSYFFYHLISMITLFFAGRLGEVELAAGTLAISFINVTGPSLFTGLSSALETLGSQAVGAKNYRMAGIALQRGVWILGIACILTCALWINAEQLLLMVGQKRNVVHLTQEFALICIPASIAIFMFFLLQRYLQTQGVVKPILYVGAVSNAIQIGINALMVYVLKWGFRGIAICWSFTNVIIFLLTFAYMRVFKLDEKTWPGTKNTPRLDHRKSVRLGTVYQACCGWNGDDLD